MYISEAFLAKQKQANYIGKMQIRFMMVYVVLAFAALVIWLTPNRTVYEIDVGLTIVLSSILVVVPVGFWAKHRAKNFFQFKGRGRPFSFLPSVLI